MAKHVARHRKRKAKEEETGPSLPLVYVAAEIDGSEVRSQGKSEKSGEIASEKLGVKSESAEADRGKLGPDRAALERARKLLEGINKTFKPYGAGERNSTEEKISEKSGETEVKALKNEVEVFHRERWKTLWKRGFFKPQISEFYGLVAVCTHFVQTDLTGSTQIIASFTEATTRFSRVFCIIVWDRLGLCLSPVQNVLKMAGFLLCAVLDSLL